jgi:hypothetical protein
MSYNVFHYKTRISKGERLLKRFKCLMYKNRTVPQGNVTCKDKCICIAKTLYSGTLKKFDGVINRTYCVIFIVINIHWQ